MAQNTELYPSLISASSHQCSFCFTLNLIRKKHNVFLADYFLKQFDDITVPKQLNWSVTLGSVGGTKSFRAITSAAVRLGFGG